jgi:molybdopterin/thiamine biosynthesis adenylyltransferase
MAALVRIRDDVPQRRLTKRRAYFMTNSTRLTARDRDRYDRQILLPEWGGEAQRALKGSTVFIAGAGGLGSAVALYLAAAGVGCLRVCDHGRVELSNLNRQVLYGERDIGKKKVISAGDAVARINSEVKTVLLDQTMEDRTVSELVADSRVIVDCLDNFETRYVLNRFAVGRKIPLVHAGVYGMAGQITFLHPPHTPCLQCIFPEAPPAEVLPIVGAAAAVIGSLETLETLKYLTETGTLLENRLLVWEGDLMTFDEISLQRDPSCPVCGKR